MTTSFRRYLVFYHNTREAHLRILLYCSFDVHWIAISCVTISYTRYSNDDDNDNDDDDDNNNNDNDNDDDDNDNDDDDNDDDDDDDDDET